MRRNIVVISFAMATLLAISGCASHQVVLPTANELYAVKQLKKKMAFLGVDERYSGLKGIDGVVGARLQSVLAQHFALVGVPMAIGPDFSGYENPANAIAMGKTLGADYLAYGVVEMAFSNLEERLIKASGQGQNADTILTVRAAHCKIQLRVIDTANGRIVTDQRSWIDREQTLDSRPVEREENNDNKGGSERGKRGGQREDRNIESVMVNALEKIAGQKMDGAGRGESHGRPEGHPRRYLLPRTFDELDSETAGLVTFMSENCAATFRQVMLGRVPLKGQILQKMNEKDVVVNLGSAYGIQPGDNLLAYRNVALMKDPATGLSIRTPSDAVALTVGDITSGISCIASGRASDIKDINVGDEVYTMEGQR
ncbi:MAG: hypothetical protein WCG06_03725 [Candidatus Omnitrophota bacterium]